MASDHFRRSMSNGTSDEGDDTHMNGASSSGGIPRSPGMAVASSPGAGWTSDWTNRGPSGAVGLKANRPLSLVGPPRRHHPYASPNAGPGPLPQTGIMSTHQMMGTPSPTWPEHIGLHDGPPYHPSRQGLSVPLLPPSAANRSRANTVMLPRPDELRRPAPPSRNQSASLIHPSADHRQRSGSLASATAFDAHRSRGESFGSASTYSTSSQASSYPQTPLLFAPLSPFEHGAGPGYASGKPLRYQQQSTRRCSAISPLVMDRLSVAEHDSPSTTGFNSSGGSNVSLSPYEHSSRGGYAPTSPTYGVPSAGRHPETWQQHGGARSPTLGPLQHQQQQAAMHQQYPLQLQQQQQPPLDRFAQTRRRRRPPYSYSSLIAQAISSAPGQRMTLREIYNWISNAYPELYSMDGHDAQGWQNTVRHNLSLNKSFVKVARTAQDIYDSCASGNPAQSQAARGKGGWWTIDPVVAAAQLGPNFRGNEYNQSAAAAVPPLPSHYHHNSQLATGPAAASGPRSASPTNGFHSADEYSPLPTPVGLAPEHPGLSIMGPPRRYGDDGLAPPGSIDGTSPAMSSGPFASQNSSPLQGDVAALPSVLQQPRHNSIPDATHEANHFPFHRQPLSFSRARGYTTTSASPDMGSSSRFLGPPRMTVRRHNSGSSSPSTRSPIMSDHHSRDGSTPRAEGSGAKEGEGVAPVAMSQEEDKSGPERLQEPEKQQEKEGSVAPESKVVEEEDQTARMSISGMLC